MHMSKTNKNKLPVLGITIGDINGVGPEIIIKTLSDQRILNYMTPVIYGSTKVLSYYRKMFEANDFNYGQVKDIDHLSHKRINVVNCWQDMVEIKVGMSTPEAGNCAYLALKEAVKDLKENKIDALVTAPINKNNIQKDDFKFPGHTEYISHELGISDSLMLMVSDNLKIGVVTGHMPLKEVSKTLSKEEVRKKLKILISTLQNDFGIVKPRIAVLGLNPHAGEEGLLGDEEENIINPVITEEKKNGYLVFGPFSADGFFAVKQDKKFDGVLAMYHDQGLVPFKILAFEEGVNFTAGISRIRTSPDHGTAYNIAGKGLANEASFRNALFVASDLVRKKQWKEVELEA